MSAKEPTAKDVSKTVRVSRVEWERVERAARLETGRTGRKVYPTVLLADYGMDGVNAILEAAGDFEAAAS